MRSDRCLTCEKFQVRLFFGMNSNFILNFSKIFQKFSPNFIKMPRKFTSGNHSRIILIKKENQNFPEFSRDRIKMPRKFLKTIPKLFCFRKLIKSPEFSQNLIEMPQKFLEIFPELSRLKRKIMTLNFSKIYWKMSKIYSSFFKICSLFVRNCLKIFFKIILKKL